MPPGFRGPIFARHFRANFSSYGRGTPRTDFDATHNKLQTQKLFSERWNSVVAVTKLLRQCFQITDYAHHHNIHENDMKHRENLDIFGLVGCGTARRRQRGKNRSYSLNRSDAIVDTKTHTFLQINSFKKTY